MNLSPAIRFLLDYARALSDHGAPADMVEDRVGAVALRLHLVAAVLATPTALLISVNDQEHSHAELMRVTPVEVDLDGLERLEVLGGSFSRGSLDLPSAQAQLSSLADSSPRFAPFVVVLAWGVISGAFARLLGGAGAEVFAAATVGTVIGLLSLSCHGVPKLTRVLLPLSGLIAAAGAGALSLAFPQVDAEITALASLVMLLPGFSVTVGTRELAEGHWLAGMARLAGACLSLAALAIGAAMGAELIPPSPTLPSPAADWTLWVALLLMAPSIVVLLRARPRDVGVVLAACITTWLLSTGAAMRWQGPLAAGCAATGMAVFAHLWARWSRRPAALWKVPGLLMLVPGSLGFRSLGGLLHGDTLLGLQQASYTLLSAAALSLGLLVGASLVPLDDRHLQD